MGSKRRGEEYNSLDYIKRTCHKAVIVKCTVTVDVSRDPYDFRNPVTAKDLIDFLTSDSQDKWCFLQADTTLFQRHQQTSITYSSLQSTFARLYSVDPLWKKRPIKTMTCDPRAIYGGTGPTDDTPTHAAADTETCF